PEAPESRLQGQPRNRPDRPLRGAHAFAQSIIHRAVHALIRLGYGDGKPRTLIGGPFHAAARAAAMYAGSSALMPSFTWRVRSSASTSSLPSASAAKICAA